MFKISGRVINGQAFGRIIGFPTANIDRREYSRRRMNIPFGIYAGAVSFAGKKYKAGIVVGPKDASGLPKVEAHLIGFKGNLYGKKLVLELKKFLRQFKEYSSKKDLQAAIAGDIKKIKKLNFNK